MLDFIIKYWLEIVFGLIATGTATIAKRFITLERKSFQDKWEKREEQMCQGIAASLTKRIEEVDTSSREGDDELYAELENVSDKLENLTKGLLSIQGKQFIDECKGLLEQEHVITVDEYERFEGDYAAYKALGGNHHGDTFHDRVVDKFEKQL